MKKLKLFLLIIGFIVGCSNTGDDTMDFLGDEMSEDMMMVTNNYSMADFVSGAHLTTGKASVNLEKTILSLNNLRRIMDLDYWFI